MRLWKVIRNILFASFLVLCSSCGVFARENVPYYVKGKFVTDENVSDFDICGVDIHFVNKSDKEVVEFTVVFFLFDEEGEPVNTTKNNLVFSIKEDLKPRDSLDICISLDDYVHYLPDENSFIDYLYVSHITYADGTVWSDPFGLSVF